MKKSKRSMWVACWALPVLCAMALGCGGSTESDYADRMATEHAGDRPVPSGAASVEPAAAIEEQTVEYATVDGQPVQGFLARPAGAEGGGPAIIVIQEWWGLNDNIRAMARRLAGEGYTALAVDLYQGQVAEDPERARELMSQSMEREPQLEDNLRQAYDYLVRETGATKVASIGWCFGGGWSLRTALMLRKNIAACVVYYGHLPTDKETLSALGSPLIGFFGAEDGGIPVDTVHAFEQTLGELGKDAEIHIYPGADHAFANPSGTRYNAEAAEDAWNKTLVFLNDHLRS